MKSRHLCSRACYIWAPLVTSASLTFSASRWKVKLQRIKHSAAATTTLWNTCGSGGGFFLFLSSSGCMIWHFFPVGKVTYAAGEYAESSSPAAAVCVCVLVEGASAIGRERNNIYIPVHFLVFSMKTHTFIHQINSKMNIKSSQDVDEVINNDFNGKY